MLHYEDHSSLGPSPVWVIFYSVLGITVAMLLTVGILYCPLKAVTFCSRRHLIYWGFPLILSSLKALSGRVWITPKVLPFWSLGWMSAQGLGQSRSTLTGWNAHGCQPLCPPGSPPSPQHPAVILCWTLWNLTLHCPLGNYLENQGTLCSFLGVLFYTLPLFSNMICTSRSPRQPQIVHSISFIQQDLIFV